jgi:hypothetical protein
MSIEAAVPIGLADNTIYYDRQSPLGWVPFECIATVTAAAAANVAVVTLPAKHLVERIIVKAQAVGANPIATGTHMGVGITGDPDYFGELAEAVVDNSDEAFIASLPGAPLYISSNTSMLLASTNGSGAAAGSLTGTWLVHVSGRAWFGFE